MSMPEPISLSEKFSGFSDHWNPRIIGCYNDSELRVAKLKGEFSWHSHAETDELFIVVDGQMHVDFREGTRSLGRGEAIVVPRGTEHRPRAEEECHVLIMDRAGEPNTGTNPSDLTRHQLETI
ncbi:MAG: cupin domain-containing protein [Pacificimonas sp.]